MLKAVPFKPSVPSNPNAVLPVTEVAHASSQVVQASVVEVVDDYQLIEPAISDAALTQSIDLTTALMLTTGQNTSCLCEISDRRIARSVGSRECA
jgi:hypothetical protein